MKISVIMPVYNSEDSVIDSARSILNQTHKDLEFLILDDASTDLTYNLVKELSYSDNRIKLFKNSSNLGLTKSLNILIKKANAEIIARQDADDFSLPNRLTIQLHELLDNNFEICTSRALIKDTGKAIPGVSYYIPHKILIKYKNPFIHGTLMAKKDVLNKLNNYDEDFYYSQDYKLFSDAIKKKFRLKSLNKKLYVLNTSNNISTINADEQKYFADCVRNNIKPFSA